MITSTDSIDNNDSNDSDDNMPSLQSVSNTSDSEDDDDDDDDSEQESWREKLGVSRSSNYEVSKMTPLSTSPAWDEVDASLKIRLTGSDSLMGLCDDAHFARSHLKETLSALLKGSTQAKAAFFCLEQMQSDDITQDLQITFAKLLPHSLLHANHLPELRTAIQQLRSQHLIYQILPAETRKAITDYLPFSGSRTAAWTVPNASITPPRPSDTITKSSTQATSQKSSTTVNSSTARRTGQKSSSTAQSPSSSGSEHLTSSQAQPVPRTSQTQPSPSASRKAQTTSRPSSLSATVQKHSAVSRAPSKDSEPVTPDPEPSAPLGPSTTSQSTLGPSHPSNSSTSSQGLLDSSHHGQGPSRRRKGKKGGKGRRK